PAAPVVAAPTVSAPVMAPKPVADRPAPAPPRVAAVHEHKPGLLLDIYRLDSEPRDFPIFASTTKPDWSGVAEGVSHEVCQKHGFHENFYARWSGSLDLLKAGEYEFFLFSDDGSRLLIDGKVVVDNGGLHGGEERGGRCTLSAGPHAVRVEYFQGTGGLVLRWQWKPAGFPRDDVPGSVLVH
ncbi:MAG: hypothetical protein J0M02_15025, partial [Planctomycetes bacterium]|nr:hypothetical protein [Planctomycetota bacterium]